MNQCDNTRLEIFISSAVDKPVTSGESHDTSVLQWLDNTFLCVPVLTSTTDLYAAAEPSLRLPLLTAAEPHNHHLNKMNHVDWKHFHFVSLHWLAATPELHKDRGEKRALECKRYLWFSRFWLHCQYHMIYCFEMTVFLILTSWLSLLFSLAFSCSCFLFFWQHKGSLTAAS